MKCYRMKHKPTGLYYCPSRNIKIKAPGILYQFVKSNLSKKGKIYTTKPSFDWIGSHFYNHLEMEEMFKSGKGDFRRHLSPFIDTDWELEEM